LGFAVLVFVYGLRWAEPVSVGVYELVSDDDDTKEDGDEVGVMIAGWSRVSLKSFTTEAQSNCGQIFKRSKKTDFPRTN
jgi:hypothetical protein